MGGGGRDQIEVPYSLRFSRGKCFVVLPSSFHGQASSHTMQLL